MPTSIKYRALMGLVAGSALLAVGAFARSDAVQPPKLDPLDPLITSATMSPRPASSVLLAVARAGRDIVAVGEGGIIVRSLDDGGHWVQVNVPVSVTLTAVTFPTAKRGWAVGHSGVILATSDGGTTWRKQAAGIETGSGDPFLDVYFSDQSNGFAVGAFGLIVHTRDGGETWIPWQSHVPNADSNHLYGIASTGSALYIVGERGAIYASMDGGDSFVPVKCPYGGSLFGVSAIREGEVLAYGLRGHILHMQNSGNAWIELKTGIDIAWTGSAKLSDGRLLIGDQAGDLVLGDIDGKAFSTVRGKWPPMSGGVEVSKRDVVIVGPKGAAVIHLPISNAVVVRR
jgi:photosystem II stability/assembly factor-like uncharacterized protein